MIIQKCTPDILNKMTALPQYTELANQVKAAYDKQELYAVDLHELKDIADSTVSTSTYCNGLIKDIAVTLVTVMIVTVCSSSCSVL
jgi:hypothetical protein